MHIAITIFTKLQTIYMIDLATNVYYLTTEHEALERPGEMIAFVYMTMTIPPLYVHSAWALCLLWIK